MSDLFRRFAHRISNLMGSAGAFVVAAVVIIVWAVSGPIFGFSDTWQLVINTGTTIVTFLMVFLIQNTQNRDGRALQLKLDELVRAVSGARNAVIDLESLSDEELDHLQKQFSRLREKASKAGRTEEVESSTEREERIAGERERRVGQAGKRAKSKGQAS